jgi:hypothetical protein
MAAGDRAKQKISERARRFIASAPVPQEQILTGAQVISGVSRGWALMSPGARMFGRPYFWRPEVEALLGALGTPG